MKKDRPSPSTPATGSTTRRGALKAALAAVAVLVGHGRGVRAADPPRKSRRRIRWLGHG